MTALDYQNVEILPDSVVYCDIPYADTTKYISEFKHSQFFDWAATREFPVYISEYEIKDPRFSLICEIYRSVKMSSKGSQSDGKKERLYCNEFALKKYQPILSLF